MDSENQLQNAAAEVPVQEMRQMYNSQGNRRSPITEEFFSIPNLTRLIKSIDDEVSRQAGFPVAILVDDVFYLTAKTHANNVPNSPDVQLGVSNLNAIVFAEQVPLHLRQIKRRKLFFKYYIYQDKAKYLSRPRMTWGRHRVNRPTTEDYYTEDPDSRQWGNFQKEVGRFNNKAQLPSLFSIYYDPEPAPDCTNSWEDVWK